MTPNTRQRKCKFAKKITKTVNSFNFSVDDQVDVLTLTLKQFSILDRFKFLRNPTRKGCSLLPRATRVAVWGIGMISALKAQTPHNLPN